ncbi:MAG: STAS domain-containing protein [Oscillochloris sp.]|nr:STAS domain-containing protein [Oscillochloris sp.]
MYSRLRHWLTSFPLADDIERRQAFIFQNLLFIWIALTSIGLPIFWAPFFFPQGGAATVQSSTEPLSTIFLWLIAINLLDGFLFWFSPIVALIVLRRGRFHLAVALVTGGLLLAHSLGTISMGITRPIMPVIFTIPLVMAGLLGGRRLLLSIASVSTTVVILTGILHYQGLPLALSRDKNISAIPTTLGFLVAIIILLTFLLDRFGNAYRESLTQALARERELINLRNSLEVTVDDRTEALRAALADVQSRADEQAKLLDQIANQELTIRDLGMPVIPVSEHILVIPLVGVLDNSRLIQLKEQALRAVERSVARLLILDVTGVAIIDSHVAQGMLQTITAVRLLGAQVALVGIRPEVAQTMVGLGIDLPNIHSFSSLREALAETFVRLNSAVPMRALPMHGHAPAPRPERP